MYPMYAACIHVVKCDSDYYCDTSQLQTTRQATLLAALKQAKKHAGKGGSKKVFLTSLGGGVFGNSMEPWLC